MKHTVQRDVELLLNISRKTVITLEHSQLVFEILSRYFGEHSRDQSFQQARGLVSKKFSELVEHFDLENGTKFASRFFLFCYTLTSLGEGYTRVQNEIYKTVAVPFQIFVKSKATNVENLMRSISEGDHYVFICRRAEVNGSYAPGKSLYTYAEALLARGESVWIIVLWSADSQFKNLKKKYDKLKISVLFDTTFSLNLISIIEILKLAEPKVILTETEFELPAVLGIVSSKIPIIYLAQGYYNLPWYDAIGINTQLDELHEGRPKKDFFDLPVWVNRHILAPEADLELINQAKAQFGINKTDFVVGAFARMEKFTEPFLSFLSRLLDQNNRLKIILAGPNDQKNVNKRLKRFIDESRAIILSEVDVNIVGHCVDLGVDTFPLHSGYSVLELMAKNIPVIAKKDEFLGALVLDRLPETLKFEEQELECLVANLIADSNLLESYKRKTDEFMSSHEKSTEFLKSLDKRINKLQNAEFQKLLDKRVSALQEKFSKDAP